MPSGGPTIAKAYVAIIPTTKDAQKNISKTLIPDLSSAGEAGGTAMSGGISGALKANAGKIASVAKTALTGAALAAVTKFVHDAYSAFSSFEQLSGGVETIFGDQAAQTVIQNAKRAFGTVQMSANDYLDTVTSFSASLIQSLGGDTEAAATMADQAIADMADNANKMGSDISSIQNAYQGFAKQNFSMLDNLKLGYGGTQQEMYRLLQDASALNEEFAQTADFSIDDKGHLTANFADITRAIHIVQENMGIAGASAQEASSTLEGSFNMMKASWQNLLVAFGEGGSETIKSAVDNFIRSTETWLSNAIPRIGIILSGIVSYLPTLASDIIAALPGFVSSIMTSLMDMIAATPFGPAISKLLNSEEVVAAFSAIRSAWDTIIGSIDTTTLSAAFDALLSAGTYISGLLSDLGAVVMDIVNGIMIPIIQGLWSFVSDHIIPGLSKLGDDLQPLLTVTLDFLAKVFEWIKVLADGLMTIIKPAIEIVFKILGPVFTQIFEWLGILFKWLGDFFTEVWAEFEPLMSLVIKYAGELFKWIGAQLQEISDKFDIVVRIISTIIRAAGERAQAVVSTVVGTIIGTVSGIVGHIQRVMSNVVSAVWNVLSGIGSAVWSLVNGIYNAASYITNALTSPFVEAFRQIKRLWNNTIGNMSFTVPSWVPGIGGSSFSMPRLAKGGTLTSSGTVMVGEAGPEILTLPRGARVTPLSSADATTGGTTYSVQVGNVDLSDDDQVRRVTREYLEFLARMATPGGVPA